jgi:hypothetical protein
VSSDAPILKKAVRKEIALLAFLLFAGLLLLPVAVYWVGETVFGQYGGQGYGDFFGTLSSKVRTGDRVAWFLILSPYLIWQTLRLMALGWRSAGRSG